MRLVSSDIGPVVTANLLCRLLLLLRRRTVRTVRWDGLLRVIVLTVAMPGTGTNLRFTD